MSMSMLVGSCQIRELSSVMCMIFSLKNPWRMETIRVLGLFFITARE